jgi:hypothetical protein
MRPQDRDGVGSDAGACAGWLTQGPVPASPAPGHSTQPHQRPDAAKRVRPCAGQRAAAGNPLRDLGQICTAGWGLTFVAVVAAILLDDRLFAL